MYYVQFSEGIKRPRILGGYSTLDKAQERVPDHIRERGKAWMPVFVKEEEEDQWRVEGSDEAYTIWASQ